MRSTGRGQAAAPPPPPASSFDEEFDDDDSTDDLLDPFRDAKFLADAGKEEEEEGRPTRRSTPRGNAAVREKDDSDISWSSDDPDAPTSGEKAAEQRALVDSFETLKKAEDAANETLWWCLLENAVAHRALAAARQVAEKQTRE
jgi:hypothetical protein